jgi:hypothetical protein
VDRVQDGGQEGRAEAPEDSAIGRSRIGHVSRSRGTRRVDATHGGGFTGLGIKTQVELPREARWHVAESWSLRRGDGKSRQEVGPSDQIFSELFQNGLGLAGLLSNVLVLPRG